MDRNVLEGIVCIGRYRMDMNKYEGIGCEGRYTIGRKVYYR